MKVVVKNEGNIFPRDRTPGTSRVLGGCNQHKLHDTGVCCSLRPNQLEITLITTVDVIGELCLGLRATHCAKCYTCISSVAKSFRKSTANLFTKCSSVQYVTIKMLAAKSDEAIYGRDARVNENKFAFFFLSN